jgi:hypothetical protein
MHADQSFYFDHLYPLQDSVLSLIDGLDTGFYLTGGTAISRVYLRHRVSDDLDLFVNYDPQFANWSGLIADVLLRQPLWQTAVVMRQQYFVRLLITAGDVTLKVEMVNDVPSHVGEVQRHPLLGRIDSPENILANKLTALINREEPRDLADVWGLCTKMGLSIQQAVEGAASKATGIYPPELARRLCTVAVRDWEQVIWLDPPDVDTYLADLVRLGDALLLV